MALEDMRALPRNLQGRVIRALEGRVAVEPRRYGERLRKSLAGLWKVRVGDYRIVYEMADWHVEVWAILHRKSVYAEVERRRSD